MSLLKKYFKRNSHEVPRKYYDLVDKVNGFSSEIEKLKDDELKGKTSEFKKRIEEGESLDSILPEAYSVVREASYRTIKQRHFDVQVLGGIAIHFGGITEMKTGEGKTLVATLPTYLNALSSNGVHVITVNDYLSKRDATWMGQIYSYLGLSVGVINHDSSFLYDDNVIESDKDKERDLIGSYHIVNEFLRPCERSDAYNADITYGTNNEFGFDYLRDNICQVKDKVVQTKHNFAIIDEVDSILIDEARTPLIISAPSGDAGSLYDIFTKVAKKLVEGEDYTVDEKLKAIILTDKGINKTEDILQIGNIYTEKGMKYVHHLETAVRSKALFQKDKDYVVKNDEIIIVDQFTGRLQPGRRWSEGLHQAIESKEGVTIKQESKTYASISFQNYFRLYKKLSGMTGTATTSSEEFLKVYGLNTYEIPTNEKNIRNDNEDLIFQSEKGKFSAIAKKVKELNVNGQPVLIGTVSIENNEMLSSYLNREGIKHEILNAKNHEREGEIIAKAGAKNAVTIATNMAGRGVDIKLGGINTDGGKYKEVKDLGGLFVLGTERHEARRIDNQLRGRSARQGDPGKTQFYVSLEDSLMRVFASDRIKQMMGKFGIEEDQPIQNKLVTRALEAAQKKIEGFNFDARKHLLEYDDVLNQQRKSLYEKRRKILFGDNEHIRLFIDNIIVKQESKDKYKDIIKEKERVLGGKNMFPTIKRVILQIMDMYWMEHLETMEYMRGSVNLRAYGQRDPLVEYKKEGLRLFKELEYSIDENILNNIHILNGTFDEIDHEWIVDSNKPTENNGRHLIETHTSGSILSGEKKNTPKETNKDGITEKIGRNDLCPCGSGKKYKHCGYINSKDHKLK